ncbi:MAG: RNA 2',3'-cyclic phosphodiesterase [Bacillota bacterium]|nr:RNA 2',3'-cyclic phosphodiesterase [Bacillota bacterium]
MKDSFNGTSKRVFIAIEFSENTKSYLNQIQQIVSSNSSSGNFTHKENFHLTLKFIGEVKIDLLDKIKKCIDNTALNQNCFQLYFDRLGQFPRRNKSIIWIGLKPNRLIDKLNLTIETSLDKIGIKKEEQSFTPHITLGRQAALNESFQLIAEKINILNDPILVDKITLMESTRIDENLKYVPLYSKSLQ